MQYNIKRSEDEPGESYVRILEEELRRIFIQCDVYALRVVITLAAVVPLSYK